MRRKGDRGRKAVALTASLGAHGALLAFLAMAIRPPPMDRLPVMPPETPAMIVALADDPRPPGGSPAPAAAEPQPAPTPPTPTPPKPVPKTPVRTPKAPPPPTVPPLPVTPSPEPAPKIEVADISAAELAGATTAGSGAGGGSGSGTGYGAGDGTGAGGSCDMVQRLQTALRRDPEVRAAVINAHRNAGRDLRAMRLWNGDWIQGQGQEGKGLAGVRQAIVMEVAFAPEACRRRAMNGLVVISFSDGAGAARIALGAGAWRWNDLLGADAARRGRRG